MKLPENETNAWLYLSAIPLLVPTHKQTIKLQHQQKSRTSMICYAATAVLCQINEGCTLKNFIQPLMYSYFSFTAESNISLLYSKWAEVINMPCFPSRFTPIFHIFSRYNHKRMCILLPFLLKDQHRKANCKQKEKRITHFQIKITQ